ncbi:MAG: regulatory protein RecX [Eubacteriales bacterium]|nr:regulatory protein RecX [Eubacteriales bacterium]
MPTPKNCHETALRYLEHRERSEYEVRTHLVSKGFLESEIEEEMNDLKGLHYVDDVRYCGDYIRYGMGKGRGPVRLQLELKEKGIDTGLIRDALAESFDRMSEKDAAMKEARKLLNQVKEMDEKTIARIGRKLASLGYHTDVTYDVIGQLRKT